MAAFIALLRIDVRLYSVKSLKEKRAIVRPLKDRLGNGFNISIIEISEQDSLEHARLLSVGAAGDTARASSSIESLINFVERNFPELDVSFDSEVIQV